MPATIASDLPSVRDRLLRDALRGQDYEAVFATLCEEIRQASVPLLRVHLAMRTLHPLLESVSLTWIRGEGLTVARHEFRGGPDEAWLRSPLYPMLVEERARLRHDLTDASVVVRYPLFEELRSLGATDYFAMMTPFGDPAVAFRRQEGVITSWTSDAPPGFAPEHLEALDSLEPCIGVVAKLSQREHTARNILAAYLGDAAGQRVLAGQIRLGDVERIPAVIWYSDMRDSTAMAERMEPESFLDAVNASFQCTAGAVLEHGGEVLRFIGDAVLAVFPVDGEDSADHVTGVALAAARDARRLLAELNAARSASNLERLEFGLGLHLGQLLFGNIGVPSRVEFSVIGRVANEVARLEALTKVVGEPVLVSRAFRDAHGGAWRDLGTHAPKGVGAGMEVFAPAD